MINDTKLIRSLVELGSLDAIKPTGTVYYVGTGGNDSNDGKTWENRRLTIASGYGLCTNGDVLKIGGGTFTEDLSLDTDGVTVIGVGIGGGTTIGGTLISGTHTVTGGSNVFKGIYFYDNDTAAAVVTIGNDANSSYNQFIDCQFSASGTCTIGLHINGTNGGDLNLVKNCIFFDGNTACLAIDSGAAIHSIIENCLFHADGTDNGHGIHINNANAHGNIVRNCTVDGGGTTGTGIYVQAGSDNYVIDCVVEDCTTLYDIAANNYAINCHEESQITADNTVEDDLADIHTDISALQSTQPVIIERAKTTLPQGAPGQTAYFTVSGRVMVVKIVGEVTVQIEGVAVSIKLIANPTVGADVDLCTAVVVNGDVVGTMYNITGTLADVMVATTSGAMISQANGIDVAAGTIDLHTDINATGEIKWSIHYIPEPGNTIVAA